MHDSGFLCLAYPSSALHRPPTLYHCTPQNGLDMVAHIPCARPATTPLCPLTADDKGAAVLLEFALARTEYSYFEGCEPAASLPPKDHDFGGAHLAEFSAKGHEFEAESAKGSEMGSNASVDLPRSAHPRPSPQKTHDVFSSLRPPSPPRSSLASSVSSSSIWGGGASPPSPPSAYRPAPSNFADYSTSRNTASLALSSSSSLPPSNPPRPPPASTFVPPPPTANFMMSATVCSVLTPPPPDLEHQLRTQQKQIASLVDLVSRLESRLSVAASPPSHPGLSRDRPPATPPPPERRSMATQLDPSVNASFMSPPAGRAPPLASATHQLPTIFRDHDAFGADLLAGCSSLTHPLPPSPPAAALLGGSMFHPRAPPTPPHTHTRARVMDSQPVASPGSPRSGGSEAASPYRSLHRAPTAVLEGARSPTAVIRAVRGY